MLSKLSHPRIVRFLAASTVPPNIFILEELAEGGSLHQRLHGLGCGGRRRRRRRGAAAALPYPTLLQVGLQQGRAVVALVVVADLTVLQPDGGAAWGGSPPQHCTWGGFQRPTQPMLCCRWLLTWQESQHPTALLAHAVLCCRWLLTWRRPCASFTREWCTATSSHRCSSAL